MKPETRSFYVVAVEKAVDAVVQGLDEALDLEALAKHAALSPFHFHRVFRGMLNETPLELHRRLRMERAAWNLLHDDAPVTSIAFAAGYETHESFTRAFRAHYQCSPSEFRQSREPSATCVRPFPVELVARSGIHFEPERGSVRQIRLTKGDPAMDVEIKNMPELRVATLSHVGPYNRISEAFARLGDVASSARLFGPESAMIALYHDDPETTPASALRSEAALIVSKTTPIPEGLGERTIPAGPYAKTTHIGPYEKLGDTWSRFMGEWLPSSGHHMRNAVSFELYRNTPQNTPKEKLVTELYIPLE